MTTFLSALHILLALTLSPLLFGIVNRTKAKFAGRRGQPLFQTYYDLAKLFRKGAVYSRTTTWAFRVGPVAGVAAGLAAISIVPLGGVPGLTAFPGDMILLVYLLALMRFTMVVSALDTGSAFEGMGAAREVQFSLLTEPVLLLGLAALAFTAKKVGLSDIYGALYAADLSSAAPTAIMVVAALAIVLLAENARIPVDDPNTHLELTMIHEAMVLDHCGVDLALIQYGAALKLWLFTALATGIGAPLRTGLPILDLFLGAACVFAAAILIGVVESTMARLRLLHVPQMLVAAGVLATTAFLWAMR